MNTGAPGPVNAVEEMAGWPRVLKIQTKLHQWAGADPGRRFDDLFNLVVDPAVLAEAWQRVRGNRGAARLAWTARRPTTSRMCGVCPCSWATFGTT